MRRILRWRRIAFIAIAGLVPTFVFWFREADETKGRFRRGVVLDVTADLYDDRSALPENQILKGKSYAKGSHAFHLITQWYLPSNHTRTLELLHALSLNVLNPHIDHIHLIQPPSPSLMDDPPFRYFTDIMPSFPFEAFLTKLVLVRASSADRLLASDAFRHASARLRGDIVALANLDVYFDDSLRLVKSLDADLSFHIAYFLSRRGAPGPDGSLPDPDDNECRWTPGVAFRGSHDAIVFVPPLPPSVIATTNIELGSWGIENRILWEFERAGIVGRNPCVDVKLWHVHGSGFKSKEMPVVNTGGKSSVAFPDTMMSGLKADYPWEVGRARAVQ
ncbi:hypothetical protein M427DRAFT_300799 [Gonapodya prolifera JEL478]|uniref:Glycosyltransferase family 69 protein n=1 Tax=Gonapodya prolifera (strain JEL478) TaxID=1344416 RepID=A0A139AH12_GONPJ|nr:hypothetical protein M427DRAFT_300799 [Gonapodya prolifera JEL478]|eukprot:KXS16101.1 hypothetical protein M427DRAFT_300799 [Gonapodya prolifera JEL478]